MTSASGAGVGEWEEVGVDAKNVGKCQCDSYVFLFYTRHVISDEKKMGQCESKSVYTWKKWPTNETAVRFFFFKVICNDI